jgi:hypothetical protein
MNDRNLDIIGVQRIKAKLPFLLSLRFSADNPTTGMLTRESMTNVFNQSFM